MDFMQARRAIIGFSLFFNHLRESGPAWFLHAGLIRSNKTFVKPARRLSRKIIPGITPAVQALEKFGYRVRAGIRHRRFALRIRHCIRPGRICSARPI